LTFRDRSGSAGSENSNDGFNVLFYLLLSLGSQLATSYIRYGEFT